MKMRDRNKKKARTTAHTREQYNARKQATLEAINKVRRAKKKMSADNMNKAMEEKGYLPTSKGGWRRMTAKEKEWYGYESH